MRPSLKPKCECEASLPVTISLRDLSELVQICHWINPEFKFFREMAQEMWQTICHEQWNSFGKTPTECNIQLMNNKEKSHTINSLLIRLKGFQMQTQPLQFICNPV
jgi:hypothetical protein